MDESEHQHVENSLAGRRIVFVGKLVSMSRRAAEQLVRDREGLVLDRAGAGADLIVVSDDTADLKRLLANRDLFDDRVRTAIDNGDAELLRESEFWSRLGLVGGNAAIERLYTSAMLAELVRVPVATIRHWQRRGVLIAKREVRRLAYFDFEDVRVARKLAQLLEAGCTLAAVNRRLDELARLLPDSPRPLVDPTVVVEGRRLLVRRDAGLAEPSGQFLIDFDVAKSPLGREFGAERPATDGCAEDAGQIAIPFVMSEALRSKSAARPRAAHPYAAEDLRSLAAELAEGGRPQQAIEALRALLFSGEFTADDHFDLAELLYQSGDLSAARERYYVAIELDDDFVEARSNLGCVLAEQEDPPLAEAAFRGALEYHPDYADAHYHLARLLDQANRREEAASHWQMFMSLAPDSPWVDEARERIGEGYRSSAIGYRPDGSQ